MKSVLVVLFVLSVGGLKAQVDTTSSDIENILRQESCTYLDYNNPVCSSTLPDFYNLDPLNNQDNYEFEDRGSPFDNNTRMDAFNNNDDILGERSFNDYEEFYEYQEVDPRLYDHEDPYDMRIRPYENLYESQQLEPNTGRQDYIRDRQNNLF